MNVTLKSHILRWQSDFFALFALSGGYRLRPARYYDSAERVSVRPASLRLMAERKGKKVLDVDVYARDTESCSS
jgi:hypothetical protein